jgi:hypothetical protein
MTDLTKLRAELRAGLDGVTPGSWCESNHIILSENLLCLGSGTYKRDAVHIARCSPENIRALLDALDDAEAHDYRKLTALGVGNGYGSLFVYGEYDAVKAAQALVFRAEKAERERDEAREALAKALNEAADEIDCGCPNRDAALAAESKADMWRACPLGTSCNARHAADIRSMKDQAQ